jgi:hypothetical protein
MVYIHSKKKRRVTRSSSHFDKGIEEFKSYMANEHFLTTTTHNNLRRVQGTIRDTFKL